jgi:rubredoxin
MSENNLQLCPNCKKGRLHPTGKGAFLRETEEPFREIDEVRKYECANCGYIQFDANITERIRASDNVSASSQERRDLEEPS